MFPTHRVVPGRRRGSVLVITLIFAAGIALSIGSYLTLSIHSARLSQQSFLANGALNLAEAGLELAFSAMNHQDYSSWSVPTGSSPSNRFMQVTNIDLGHGVVGRINVLIYGISAATPRVIAEGTATPPWGSGARKQIQMRATSRSIFATGLVSKDKLAFSGNGVSVDSWNSDPDGDGLNIIPYSEATKNDNGSVASNAVTISIGNADVWGYVATGGGQPEVGSMGTIASYGSPQGTKDPERISTDFKHNFDPIVVPVPAAVNTIADTIGSNDEPVPMTLPRTGDVTWIDPEDETATPKYYYKLPGIDLAGTTTNILTISDDVVLLPTAGSGATAIAVGGNASITIANGGSLAIYTEGDIDIAGNGIANGSSGGSTGAMLATANQPQTLQIYGTNTSAAGQSIHIAGNGVLSAVGYAPNADITLHGGGNNGHVLGAFVANTISITGNNSFHYDESLKDFGGGTSFELAAWIELFGSQQIEF